MARSSATFTVGGQEFDLAPDATELPIHGEKTGSPLVGLIMLTAAVGDIVIALVMIGLGLSRQFLPGLPLGIAMLVGGVIFSLVGRHLQVMLDEWDLTDSHVAHRKQGLFGQKEWTEPMSAYDGVLARQERHSGGENSQSYTLHILELRHNSDKKRNARLYCSRKSEGFRAKQEHYGRLLNMPVLIETATGIEERRPEDLDKSVRQRVAEGSMKVTFDPSAKPPGKRLQTRIEGDRLVISTGLFSLKWLALVVPILVSAMVAAGVIGAVVGKPAVALSVVAVAIPICALVAVAALLARKVRQELRISPSEVATRWVLPWRTVAERSVPADDVEDVLIQTPPNSSGVTMVCVLTDDDVLPYGFALKQPEKEWVRDCIIAVISR